MRELWARLGQNPGAVARVLFASFLINGLGLVSSLYMTHVYNRYITYGITATLVTLTVGVVMAIVAEYGFRNLRLLLAQEIVADSDARISTGLFGLFLTARLSALETRPPGERMELMRGAEQAEAALSAATLATLADLPFSLLFLAVLALVSPPLAGVVGVALLGLLAAGWGGQRQAQSPVRQLSGLAARLHALVVTTLTAAETLRQFGGGGLAMQSWREQSDQARGLRTRVAFQQARMVSLAQAIQALAGVAVVAVGAVQVVHQTLDMGLLIGASLMASRALAPFSRLIPLGVALRRADVSLGQARRFAALAVEPATGATLPEVRGKVEFKAVGFHTPGYALPLFQGFSLHLEPGEVLAITGRNGSGKSVLARLITGLAEPTAGQILVDGVDIRQFAPGWWRRQVCYLPQDPLFLEATVRDNFRVVMPGLEDEALRRLLEETGLRRFFDSHPRGLDFVLQNGGLNLAPGLRRRLALARALAVPGALAVLDEPSAGLDREGAGLMFERLVDLAGRGRTVIVISHDPALLGLARRTLDLDAPASASGPGPGRWPERKAITDCSPSGNHPNAVPGR